MRPAWLIAGLLAGAIGFASGRLSAARKAPSLAPAACPELTADVRAAVRAELATVRLGAAAPAAPATAAPTAAADPAPAPPATPATPEQASARDAALRLVNDAVAAHRWGDDQAMRMRVLLARMTPEDRDEVVHTLLPAINRGEVDVAVQGPPF